MTELILGPAGSGKTTVITERILADLTAGRRVMLIVPEQAAVSAESALCTAAQQRRIPQTQLEILNFKRLCNRVFREYGGIAYHTVTPGAKALLLWEALFSTAPFLKQYKGEVEDAKRFVPVLLSAIGECKAYGITAAALADAADECAEESPRLADKLQDLSLIYAEYTRLLTSDRDDPADDLTRLDNTLAEHRFFEGISLYFDGFVGFTPQEYRILFHAFKQAENVTLTFCTDRKRDSMAFEQADNELRKLISLCGKQTPKITELTDTHRFVSPELAYLEKNLWAMGTAEPYSAEATAIRTVLTSGLYDEAEFVANDIARRLRDGASYRDFAVIARQIDRYDGILDAVFETFGLPCHMGRRLPLSERPVFKLVLSALAIKNNGWHTEDVIAYLKTGLTPITPEECDLLETYASCWNILGKRWYSEDDWYMNPDGYTDRLTEEGRTLLQQVNDIRRKLTQPLVKLHEVFDGKHSVTEICQAVYTFFEELALPERIASSGCDEDVLLWNALCDALDTMVDILSERKSDALLFAGLFSLVVSQTNTGTLPSAVDEIAVGSADRIRAEGVKHVYLLGVNEGVFPAACGESGLFSDSEKATLETCGIILSPDSDAASVSELFRFYTAACTPSETLTVICSKCDVSGGAMKPSLAFDRIRALFPLSPCLDTEAMGFDHKINNKKASLELATYLAGTEEGEALRRLFREDPLYAHFFDGDRQPLVTEEERLDEDTAALLFGGDVALTQSRLDRYVLCAFGYQCSYVLKLKEQNRAEFRAADTGNMVHRILENFFSAITKDKETVPSMTDEELDTLLDEILADYLSGIFGHGKDQRLSPRALQLFKRLRRSVRILIRNLLDEFEQSEFTPRFFEMPINTSGDEGTVAPLAIPLPDGNKAYLYGIADRVDICRKGKDVYVRVVDYKTGSKDFSLYDISLGLNLQMLLYLFSLWKDGSGSFRRSVGCEGDIIPAGVLYCTAKTASVTATAEMTDAEIYEKVEATLKRKGLLLDDEEVLRLMEAKLTGKYIPVTLKKDGSLATSLTLETLEGLGKLMEEVTKTVAKLATEIKQGYASCHPLKDAKHDACRYCPHKSICRNPAAFVTAY